MAARAVRGLSGADLDRVRESLAAGRKPKVVFTESAGQLAGQLGQVVELTDPAAGEEWVVVRFGRDTLSFAPTDLAPPPKAVRPARRGPVKAAVPVAAAVPVPAAASGEAPGNPPRRRAEDHPQPVDSAPAAAAAPKAPVAKDLVPKDPVPKDPVPKAPARKAARSKAPAGLAVTLAYTDGAWTVAAQQGSRVLAKPTSVRAGEALKLIGQLDLPDVQAAVDEIVAADRVAAEHEADRLRAELAEVEARLADLGT
jgi:hypothetical protein